MSKFQIGDKVLIKLTEHSNISPAWHYGHPTRSKFMNPGKFVNATVINVYPGKDGDVYTVDFQDEVLLDNGRAVGQFEGFNETDLEL